MDPSLNTILQPYQQRFERFLPEGLKLLGDKNGLRDACEYAMCGQGKRIRPAIVYMIADALGNGLDVSYAALAIEYLHTASLIADDLPCMDDDDLRRGRASCHKAFGETTALLASYGLIAAGYEALAINSRQFAQSRKTQSTEVAVLALEVTAKASGNAGLTGGQFLDIYPPTADPQTLRCMIQGKAGAYFAASFALGWLFGGGDPTKLAQVKQAGAHFGLIFQMTDDLDDAEQDRARGAVLNTACLLGRERTVELIQQESDALFDVLKALQLRFDQLEAMNIAFLAIAKQSAALAT